MANFTPEKCKQIALARLDVVHKWLEFRKKSQNKLQADYDFVKLHNTSNSHLYEVLGKISHGSLHRWYAMLNGTEDYTKLLPQYKYSTVREYRTVLNDEEIKIFIFPRELIRQCLKENNLKDGKSIEDFLKASFGEFIQEALEAEMDEELGYTKGIYPNTEIQRCIVHQIRNSSKFVPWKDRKAFCADMKKIYNAINEEQALVV